MGVTDAMLFSLVTKFMDEIKKFVFDKDTIVKVRNIPVPVKTVKEFLDRVSITATKFNEKADVSFQNPWDAMARVTAVSIIPDATAKTNCTLKVKVSEATLLNVNDAADLTDVSALPLTLPNEGLMIRANEKVELFAKTSAGTSVLTFVVTFQKSE